MRKNNGFEYEIVEHLGQISESGSWKKCVRRVSFNGDPVKVDIRPWNEAENPKYVMGKGISLTDEECENLVNILIEYGYGQSNK
jgi:hypothetical protein